MPLLPPISAREVAEGLYGATRLAKGDPHGIQFFGDTPEAFWKSFWAAAIAAPAYALLVAIDLSGEHVTSGWLRVVLIECVSYVAAWVAFPLAMHYVAEFIDREEQYIRYICASNWGSVLQVTLYLFVTAFLALDVLPHALAVIVSLAAYGAIFLYQWWVARVGLDLGRGGAVGARLLDQRLRLGAGGRDRRGGVGVGLRERARRLGARLREQRVPQRAEVHGSTAQTSPGRSSSRSASSS